MSQFYTNSNNYFIFMSVRTLQSQQDPTILACCLQENQEPYIGVDANCNKSAIFCLQHSSHLNSEGLMHQMLSLKQFKRTVFSKKFIMQEKVQSLINTFNNFMDTLIEQIRELKLRKSIELSMLWLRELANDENQYELMKQVYRMDFRKLTCQDIHSIYFKIIHNDALYSQQLKNIKCYQGISQVLQDIAQNKKAIRIISDKIAQIQGVLTSGKILRKVLPDQRVLKPNVKEVLLQEAKDQKRYQINYYKAILKSSTHKHVSIFSKYCAVPHTTYHIAIKTKYSNVMLGICTENVKSRNSQVDLHYDLESIVFNCANGNTYRDGMFYSGSNAAIKGLTQIVLKLRLTDEEIIVMTKNDVLMRAPLGKMKGSFYLHLLARTKGDYFELQRDKEMSADNLGLLKTIQKHLEYKKPIFEGPQSIKGEAKSQQKLQDSQLKSSYCQRSESEVLEDINPNKADRLPFNFDSQFDPQGNHPRPQVESPRLNQSQYGDHNNRITQQNEQDYEKSEEYSGQPLMLDDASSPIKAGKTFEQLKLRYLQKFSSDPRRRFQIQPTTKLLQEIDVKAPTAHQQNNSVQMHSQQQYSESQVLSQQSLKRKIDDTVHLKPVQEKRKTNVFPLSFDNNLGDSFRGLSTNQQNITGFTSIRQKSNNTDRGLSDRGLSDRGLSDRGHSDKGHSDRDHQSQFKSNVQVYVSADLSDDASFFTKSKSNMREMNIAVGEKTQKRLEQVEPIQDQYNSHMKAPQIRNTYMRESNESYDFN